MTVEVLVSAISAGTERAQWLRLPNAQPAFPYSPGYSAAGLVLAAGAEADGLRAGQAVAVARVPHASVGTVPAAWATPVPDGVELSEAALVYLGIIAGYGVRRAGPLEHRSLCVIGAGPIGALAARLAARRQPERLVVVAASERRRLQALAAGADDFLTADEALESVAAAVVIEATGDPEGLAGAVSAAEPGATVVLLGSPRGETPASIVAAAQGRGLTLVGAHISSLATEAKRVGGDPFADLAREFVGALADGSMSVADLVGERLDPREPTLAYRRLARGEVREAHFDWRRIPRGDRVRRRRLLSPPALLPLDVRLRPPPVRRAAPEPALRFALVGCGDIGHYNARGIAGARNAELAACYDPLHRLAEACAARYGGAAVATLEEALDPDRVGAVLLAVPHDVHAPLAETTAAAGLHMIVEEPLAQDLSERRARHGRGRRPPAWPFSVRFPRIAAGPAVAAPRRTCVPRRRPRPRPSGAWVRVYSGRARLLLG